MDSKLEIPNLPQEITSTGTKEVALFVVDNFNFSSYAEAVRLREKVSRILTSI